MNIRMTPDALWPTYQTIKRETSMTEQKRRIEDQLPEQRIDWEHGGEPSSEPIRIERQQALLNCAAALLKAECAQCAAVVFPESDPQQFVMIGAADDILRLLPLPGATDGMLRATMREITTLLIDDQNIDHLLDDTDLVRLLSAITAMAVRRAALDASPSAAPAAGQAGLASELLYLLEYIENEAVRNEAKRKAAELLAAPVAATEQATIDTDEFHVFMNEYDNEASYGSINKARTDLVNFINRHFAAPLATPAATEQATVLDIMSLIREQGHRQYLAAGDDADPDWTLMPKIEAAIRALATPADAGAGQELTDERIKEICEAEGLGPCLGLAVGRAIEREVLARLSTPGAPVTAEPVAAWECLDRFEQWAAEEGHEIGPRSQWANNKNSLGFDMWVGWQGAVRKIAAAPAAPLATPADAGAGAATKAKLTDERILRIGEESAINYVTDERHPDNATIIDFARAIEREVLARMSTSGAPVTASEQQKECAPPFAAPASQHDDGWPGEIYLNSGEGPLRHFSEYDEVDWCDHPQGESDVRYVRADVITPSTSIDTPEFRELVTAYREADRVFPTGTQSPMEVAYQAIVRSAEQFARRRPKVQLSPEMKAALDKAHETGSTIAETPHGIAFINYGHDYGDNAHLECPACGGSGHIDDYRASQSPAPVTAEPAPNLEDRPENEQEWAKVDPATAFHLIDRHAENWADAGRMMLAWRDANPAPADRDAIRDEAQQWISVDERLPEVEVPVLMYGRDAVSVHCGKGGLMVGKLRASSEGGTYWLNLISGSSEARFVTHWMPLPAKPDSMERAADAIQDQAQYKPVGKFLYVGMAYEATSSDDPRGITLYRAADAAETRDAKGDK